jgi:uncharacterized repeat protein (TIGR03803 family)
MSKFSWGIRACGVVLLWATAAVALPAQTFTTLHSFDGTDGANPTAGLVQAANGDLYGTTTGGGTNGYGAIFKITPIGTLTMLHSFNATDGDGPKAALVQGATGNLYGTTYQGGANNAGTVFKITSGGTLTTLHSFDHTDGYEPYYAALVQASNGDFYGTTYKGAKGFGTIFKTTPSGSLTMFYRFDGTDGANPVGGLVQGIDENFYGTTTYGGDTLNGTVFKITSSRMLTTLYSFCPHPHKHKGCADGANPEAALVQGTDGNFYGTTIGGGAEGKFYGTIFKITSGGTLTTLHTFCQTLNGCPDGEAPAGLIQATDGNFYGTALGGGGNSSAGTVFRITPGGTLTTLYNFCPQLGCEDGALPFAGLVQDTNGILYGTTYQGGANNAGTVFSLSVGLGPFVETQPTSGQVGKAVKILGTNLTGATSVTFNGTAAAFMVKSKSEIIATVPLGATTGKVKVTSPRGTLTSNVPFRVR